MHSFPMDTLYEKRIINKITTNLALKSSMIPFACNFVVSLWDEKKSLQLSLSFSIKPTSVANPSTPHTQRCQKAWQAADKLSSLNLLKAIRQAFILFFYMSIFLLGPSDVLSRHHRMSTMLLAIL